jgi:PTH1 family peptidyl-tRNA hydrolase
VHGVPRGKGLVIVGLGNPGKGYERHRHNVGFMVADELCREAGCAWNRDNRVKALICTVEVGDREAVLVKPRTFMNLSGTAVAPIVKRFNADPARMIVVHDDLDILPGRIRIKSGGGDGGHRGVRSIADSLRFRDFIRIRIGIGRPPEGMSAERFVLTSFPHDDAEFLHRCVEEGARAVKLAATLGVDAARNKIHSVNIEPERSEE